ncbi:MAG: hypothetical protein LBP41_03285 [Holosporaceae bacterium]|nr:hypothetical protein [Holosporaceae bacterium]
MSLLMAVMLSSVNGIEKLQHIDDYEFSKHEQGFNSKLIQDAKLDEQDLILKFFLKTNPQESQKAIGELLDLNKFSTVEAIFPSAKRNVPGFCTFLLDGYNKNPDKMFCYLKAGLMVLQQLNLSAPASIMIDKFVLSIGSGLKSLDLYEKIRETLVKMLVRYVKSPKKSETVVDISAQKYEFTYETMEQILNGFKIASSVQMIRYMAKTALKNCKELQRIEPVELDGDKSATQFIEFLRKKNVSTNSSSSNNSLQLLKTVFIVLAGNETARSPYGDINVGNHMVTMNDLGDYQRLKEYASSIAKEMADE